ncbi:MAG TPA: alginate lyase family protein [Acidimicrobiia bacterium]|jgi:hypothetical protein|nr:alginate lyase family protein [Acidimicrobiia bacterium]
MDLKWYVNRLKAMSPAEVAQRARDEALHQTWRFTADGVKPAAINPAMPAPLPEDAARAIDPEHVEALVAAAERIAGGTWTALGVTRDDLAPRPDWFWDPATGVRSDPKRYAFDLNPRDPKTVGNVKNVWELSRHHHVSVLAAAYHVTRDDRYAEAAATQLRSWWHDNPFLRGIHWTSGIELGIRLIAWIWVRRLLDPWEGAAGLFEASETFTSQLYWHQAYLARFPSHGSSANNHLIAEEAGQFAASCAFPMFPESAEWRERSAAVLEREIELQTFPSGLNRELASDYHGFVTELFLAAAIEGIRGGHPLSSGYIKTLARMADAGAAFVDGRMQEPRQGDGDQGLALDLDGNPRQRWRTLLPTLDRLVGRCSWWPATEETDVRTALWTAGIQRRVHGRLPVRPNVFNDAGMVILRDLEPGPDEIWCRCDGGPFGYLSIAGHAHADALSVELRHGGIEVLADPGTFCYHVDPEWRSYFRSTRAHNTLEVAGRDQAEPAGPFNWTTHADAETLSVAGLDGGRHAAWSGRHEGYRRLDSPAVHHRSVVLDRHARRLVIRDSLDAKLKQEVRLSFHLGPTIDCRLEDHGAQLSWKTDTGLRTARLVLPDRLEWQAARGETSPPQGWYSPQLGARIPAFTLFGVGIMDNAAVLESVVEFDNE